MINNSSSFAGIWGQADRLTARQGKRARREEMEIADKAFINKKFKHIGMNARYMADAHYNLCLH